MEGDATHMVNFFHLFQILPRFRLNSFLYHTKEMECTCNILCVPTNLDIWVTHTFSLHTKSCKVAATKSHKIVATKSQQLGAARLLQLRAARLLQLGAAGLLQLRAARLLQLKAAKLICIQKLTSCNYAATSCSN